MSQSLVQHNQTTGSAVTSLAATLSSVTAASNFLVAYVSASPTSATAPTITQPTGWLQADVSLPVAKINVGIYYLENCGSGLTSFTFTFGVSCDVAIEVEERSGLFTSASLDVHTTGSTNTTAVSTGTTATTAQADELVVFCIGYDNSGALTYSGVTAGYTASADNTISSTGAPQANLAVWAQETSSTGAQSASLTLSAAPSGASHNTGVVIAAFKVASGSVALTAGTAAAIASSPAAVAIDLVYAPVAATFSPFVLAVLYAMLQASTATALSPPHAATLSFASTSYRGTVLGDSPLWYAPIDDLTGVPVVDASPNGISTAVTNPSGVSFAQPALISGDSAGSLLFNAGTGQILTDGLGQLPAGAAAWTMETWVNTVSTSSGFFMSFGVLGASPSGDPWLSVDTSGTLIHAGYSGTGALVSSAALALGVHHVVYTYNGTVATLYIDGASVGTNTFAMNVPAVGFLTLGRLTWANNYVAHLGMGHVAFYKTALASTQVSNHYAARTSGYAAAVLGDSPLVYYKLGDASTATTTTLADISGNAHNGIYTGTWALAPELLKGDTGLYSQFGDGSSTYATVTNTADIHPAGACSFEVWLRSDNPLQQQQGLLESYGGGGASNNGFALRTSFNNTDGHVYWLVVSAGSVVSTLKSTSALSSNTLYHLVATYDPTGNVTKLYINGVQDAVTSTAPALGTLNGDLMVAARAGDHATSTILLGAMAHAAIYGTVLTQAQVTAHYQAGITAQGMSAPIAAAVAFAGSATLTVADSLTALAAAAIASSPSAVVDDLLLAGTAAAIASAPSAALGDPLASALAAAIASSPAALLSDLLAAPSATAVASASAATLSEVVALAAPVAAAIASSPAASIAQGGLSAGIAAAIASSPAAILDVADALIAPVAAAFASSPAAVLADLESVPTAAAFASSLSATLSIYQGLNASIASTFATAQTAVLSEQVALLANTANAIASSPAAAFGSGMVLSAPTAAAIAPFNLSALSLIVPIYANTAAAIAPPDMGNVSFIAALSSNVAAADAASPTATLSIIEIMDALHVSAYASSPPILLTVAVSLLASPALSRATSTAATLLIDTSLLAGADTALATSPTAVMLPGNGALTAGTAAAFSTPRPAVLVNQGQLTALHAAALAISVPARLPMVPTMLTAIASASAVTPVVIRRAVPHPFGLIIPASYRFGDGSGGYNHISTRALGITYAVNAYRNVALGVTYSAQLTGKSSVAVAYTTTPMTTTLNGTVRVFAINGNYSIPAPSGMTFGFPVAVGEDIDGNSLRQGYTAITWTYDVLLDSDMGLIMAQYNPAAPAVTVTYPNELGMQVTKDAYMMPPVLGDRSTVISSNVQFTFTHISSD